MERREFLKIALGAAAGAAALAASAQAAPLMPQPFDENARIPNTQKPHPAVTSEDEASRLAPEEVRWSHGRHWGWRRRHWGWHRRRRWYRRRYWRRRYW